MDDNERDFYMDKDNGIEFEMQELEKMKLQREKQMIRDLYLTKAADGYEYYKVLAMTPEHLKMHESHRPFYHNGDNRKGLEVIKDRQNLTNEKNYLNGKI
jgi:hypothetical protein